LGHQPFVRRPTTRAPPVLRLHPARPALVAGRARLGRRGHGHRRGRASRRRAVPPSRTEL